MWDVGRPIREFLAALQSLSDVVAPPRCLLCNAIGGEICATCAEPWLLPPRKVNFDGYPLYFTSIYGVESTRVVLAAKEDRSQVALRVMGSSIANSLTSLLGTGQSSVAVVPIPSRPKADRVRGHRAGQSLAKAAVAATGPALRDRLSVIEALDLSHRVSDQSGLSRDQRRQNLASAFSVNHRQIPQLRSSEVVIVDDVVTSGSTMREALRALKERKIEPLGLITACRALSD